MSETLTVLIDDATLDAIAKRASDVVLESLAVMSTDSPYLTVGEAAAFLRAKPQRVYDLLSSHRLTRFKDGRRVLIARAEIENYLTSRSESRIAPALPPGGRNHSARRIAA